MDVQNRILRMGRDTEIVVAPLSNLPSNNNKSDEYYTASPPWRIQPTSGYTCLFPFSSLSKKETMFDIPPINTVYLHPKNLVALSGRLIHIRKMSIFLIREFVQECMLKYKRINLLQLRYGPLNHRLTRNHERQCW